MTITVAQVGTAGVAVAPATGATATLPSAPTVGNLIVVSSSNSTGSQSLNILEGGSFATAGLQNASPREKIYWGLSTGIERTFTVSSPTGTGGAWSVQVREFNITQALTVNNATGTNAFPFAASVAPGTLTGPVASQSGEALAIALLGASATTNAFAGLAASGWTVTADDIFGRAGQAFRTLTLTAGGFLRGADHRTTRPHHNPAAAATPRYRGCMDERESDFAGGGTRRRNRHPQDESRGRPHRLGLSRLHRRWWGRGGRD